jgi:hypothetical protein
VDIFAIVIGFFILAGVTYYISRPLARPKRAGQIGADVLSLEALRESLYTQIKELDLDHATGKVNDEDYARLRPELVAKAAAVLKQIDGVAPLPEPAPTAPAVDDELEALIAARRKSRSVSALPAASLSDDDVEAAIAARRKSTRPVATASASCPKCGKPASLDDAFCAKCGAALQPQAVP